MEQATWNCLLVEHETWDEHYHRNGETYWAPIVGADGRRTA